MAIGIGDAKLIYSFPDKGGRGSISGTLNLPLITNIERTANVNLSEMPTLIYGAENNFCIDLGATEKVTFKCVRTCPIPYDDSSDDPVNADKWSNAKWYRYLEKIFDRWQNFGMHEGVNTGGVYLIFKSIDTSLYPDLKCNVFLAGSLGLSYDVQKISFNLPFQLGNMQMKDVDIKYITLTLKSEYSSESGSGTRTATLEVLPNTPQQIPFPSTGGWSSTMVEGKTFIGWTRSDGTFIADGATYIFGSSETLAAVWVGAIYATYFIEDNHNYLIPCNANRMVVYAVGGGGGGGGSVEYGWTIGTSTAISENAGGGGGAGEAVIYTTNAWMNEKLDITIGQGGTGGTNRLVTGYNNQPTAGGTGGDTIIKCESGTVITARGGSGGGAAYNPANPYQGRDGTPGLQYVSGGAPGKDGSVGSPNVSSNRGLGGADGKNSYGDVKGGGGGGAAAFYYAANYGSIRLPQSGYFESKGGHGRSYDSDGNVTREASSGQIGGGGGSGYTKNGERTAEGSPGMVLIVFYNTEVYR